MKWTSLSIIGVLFLSGPLFSGEALSWTGKWTSVKRKENGKVTCTLKKKGRKWQALFDGDKKGQKFYFKAPVELKKQGESYKFEGTAKVGGDPYELTGAFTQETFNASYKSESGNTGTLTLKKEK